MPRGGFRYATSLRSDPRRKLPPGLQRPMPGRRARRGGEHEHVGKLLVSLLPPQRNHAGRFAIKQARSLLARERNGLRPVLLDLGPESRHVDRCCLDLVIHPGARLGEIGEADPELEQRGELARLITARRDAGLMDRAPEAVAGMGVVVPITGLTACWLLCPQRPAEDALEAGPGVYRTCGRASQRPIALLHLLRIQVHA